MQVILLCTYLTVIQKPVFAFLKQTLPSDAEVYLGAAVPALCKPQSSSNELLITAAAQCWHPVEYCNHSLSLHF